MDTNINKSEGPHDIPKLFTGERTRPGGPAPKLAWHTPALKELKAATHTLAAQHGITTYADLFSYTS